MYDIYRRHRAEYDRLVNAEDHERHLPAFLHSLADWRGKTALEGGLGTGRVTEMYADRARRVVGCDREPHMLEAARERLAPFAHKLDLRVADNLDLPLLPQQADIFIEGWSWGHSIVDGPGSVEDIAAALFAQVRKNLVPGARSSSSKPSAPTPSPPPPPTPASPNSISCSNRNTASSRLPSPPTTVFLPPPPPPKPSASSSATPWPAPSAPPPSPNGPAFGMAPSRLDPARAPTHTSCRQGE